MIEAADLSRGASGGKLRHCIDSNLQCLMRGLSPTRLSAITDIVIPRLGGLDRVIQAGAAELIERFRHELAQIDARTLSGLRFVGIVTSDNELTEQGVRTLKEIAGGLRADER
jgi:hypothetical protein